MSPESRHHDHHHRHPHGVAHHDHPEGRRLIGREILVIRPNSGISGDIMAAGLLSLLESRQEHLDTLLAELNMPHLTGRVRLVDRAVNQINGCGLEVDLPGEHEHRGLAEIEEFFSRTALSDPAKALARHIFRLLAEAEGSAHGLAPEEIHFHEVGALDSILDIGLAAALLTRLSPARIVCGPLPVCDGVIKCQHGLLSSPAPAVMHLLKNVPVTPLATRGETVTPTGLAILKGAGAEFGPWPRVTVERHTLVYGTRQLEGVPNGALFVWGQNHDFGREHASRHHPFEEGK